jgi:3-polyprenyl-4-hydroxybenzoate decarboxylase
MTEQFRLIVGISGASGVIYGVRLLEALKPLPVETHLVMTRTAEVTLAHETKWKVADVRRLADVALSDRRSHWRGFEWVVPDCGYGRGALLYA